MKIWNKTHSISICLRVQVPYFPSQSFPRETGGLRKATQGPQALGSFVSRRLAQYQVWMTFSNIFWISETETFLPQPTALQNSDMKRKSSNHLIEFGKAASKLDKLSRRTGISCCVIHCPLHTSLSKMTRTMQALFHFRQTPVSLGKNLTSDLASFKKNENCDLKKLY